MKRSATFCILLALLVSLSACGQKDEQPESDSAEPTSTTVVSVATLAPTELPAEPTPEPVVVPLLDPASITYAEDSNETLGIQYKVPDQWVAVYGRRTLCYEEPTTTGIEPARVAITATDAKTKPTAIDMQTQMTRFTQLLEGDYEALTLIDYKEGVKLMGVSGFRQTYTATRNGQEIRGYVILSYYAQSAKIYLMHFSAPVARYDELSDVLNEIRLSILPPA